MRFIRPDSNGHYTEVPNLAKEMFLVNCKNIVYNEDDCQLFESRDELVDWLLQFDYSRFRIESIKYDEVFFVI